METNNKFLVINCKNLLVRKYEDRKFIGMVKIDIDEDTTSSGLKAALENYRIS